MPPTSMNDGLSLTAPAQAPQRKTNHAAGTPAILAAVMSLSFAAPCATTPVPATRKLRRRIGEWPRRAAITSEAAARIDRSRETVCASHRIAGCWGCPAQTKPESCTHTHTFSCTVHRFRPAACIRDRSGPPAPPCQAAQMIPTAWPPSTSPALWQPHLRSHLLSPRRRVQRAGAHQHSQLWKRSNPIFEPRHPQPAPAKQLLHSTTRMRHGHARRNTST